MDEIIFKTTQHCIDYVKHIKTQDDILSSIDRKTLFKARQYFVANFNSFSSENIFFLLNNEYFKSFTNLQAEDLLKACNLKETSLPVFFKQWSHCEPHLLEPYLKQVANKYPEQLREFFEIERGKNIILSIFKEANITNDLLIELVIEHDCVNVLNTNWKSEKIIQWLEDNPQHIFKIAGHLVVSPNQSASSSIRDKIYELIIQEHINQKELLLDSHINPDTPIAVFLTHFNQPFIKKFQEMDSALLNSMIKKTILFVEDGTAKDKPVLTLNLGQYAYITHTRNWNIVDAEILLSSFKSDILKPIEVNFNFLEYKENIFEYFFKNSNLDVKFSIGLKQEFPNLSEEEKKMYTASCMKILSKQNSLGTNTQNLIDLLDVVPSKMANLYFSKAIDFFNQNITSYVSTHLLKNGLEKNLETRTITKQPKI